MRFLNENKSEQDYEGNTNDYNNGTDICETKVNNGSFKQGPQHSISQLLIQIKIVGTDLFNRNGTEFNCT